MTFQLDTSGYIRVWKGDRADDYRWLDLSPFVQGYVEAMFADTWRARHALAASACTLQANALQRKIPGNMIAGRDQQQLVINKLRVRADRHRAKAAEGCRKNQIPGGLGFSDLAPETLARIIEDCAQITTDPAGRAPGDKESWNWPNTETSGRRFWKGRNLGQLPNFSPLTIYLGDDGLVRFQ